MSTVRPIFIAVSSSAPKDFAIASAALYVAVRVFLPTIIVKGVRVVTTMSRSIARFTIDGFDE